MKDLRIETFEDRPAWLRFRTHSIGASDAPVIMDRIRYGKRSELIKHKAFGIVGEQNDYIVKQKSQAEEKAVQYILRNLIEANELLYEARNQPCYSCVVSLRKTLKIHATFDSQIGRRYAPDEPVFVEVKCVEKASNPSASEIPPDYLLQLVHQFAVAKAFSPKAHLIYIEYSESEDKVLKSFLFREKHDFKEHFGDLYQGSYDDLWEYMLGEYEKFMHEVELERTKGNKQVMLSQEDQDKLQSLVNEYNSILPELETVKEIYEAIEQRAKAVKEKMAAIIGEKEYSFSHQGLKVKRIEVQGGIDIEKLPLNINIKDLRKPSSYQLRITKEKEKKIMDNLSAISAKMKPKSTDS